jgi:hypothetical protein
VVIGVNNLGRNGDLAHPDNHDEWVADMAPEPCVEIKVTVCMHESRVDIIFPVDTKHERASAGVVELAALEQAGMSRDQELCKNGPGARFVLAPADHCVDARHAASFEVEYTWSIGRCSCSSSVQPACLEFACEK